jgi:N utilization substance protein B
VAELIARRGSPVAVVIDQAIELAKRYGTDESGRFVNGVLDRVARTLRPEET